MSVSTTLPVMIRQIRLEAQDVHAFELAAPDGAPLPAFSAGAHVDLDLPGRLRRSYSLFGREAAAQAGGSWHIAVKREAAGRGGSAWLHDSARVGQVLQATPPVNHFALDESATSQVLVAGGIGITPVLAMVERLAALGRHWQLHYSARTPEQMAFRERLQALAAASGGDLRLHYSGPVGARLDLAAIVAGLPAGAHLYACGPNALLDDLLAAALHQGVDPARCHVERFAAAQVPDTAGGFTVELARDGRVLQVPAGKSVLDVLLDAGVDVPYSCMQGICGSCRVRVNAGEPEHRDDCLSDDERAQGVMAVCCSGARSSHLLLDL